MKITRRTAAALLAGSLSAFAIDPAFANGTVVNVSLWDKGDSSMNMLGEVTFRVVNDAKDLIHEMVLAPVADTASPLPCLGDEEKVDEDAAVHLRAVESWIRGVPAASRSGSNRANTSSTATFPAIM